MTFDRAAITAMKHTADRYHANLSPECREYLHGRGLTNELISDYRLGTCDDIHEGWLSIPYLRRNGVASIKFRRLDDDKPKYIGHGKPHLYNTAVLDRADDTGEIAICEGELDALVATSLCGVPAVGIPGATMWTNNRHWHELFTGYQRIHVLADPDEAGLSLASAILEVLPNARLVKLPADVNDVYLRHGSLKDYL